MIITQQGRLYIALYIASNILRIYSIYRFMHIFFNRKTSLKWIEILLFIIYFLVNSLGFIAFRNLGINIATNIILCILITCLYPGKISSKLFLTSLIYGINIAWDSIIGAAFFPTKNYFLTTGILTSLCVFLTEIIFEQFRVITSGINTQLNGGKKFLCLIPSTSIFFTALNYKLGFRTHIALINLIGLLLIDFALFYIYGCLVQESTNNYERQLLEEQNMSYQHQYALMEKSIIDLRHFRHDIKMHSNALMVMLQDDRKEDALEYLVQHPASF